MQVYWYVYIHTHDMYRYTTQHRWFNASQSKAGCGEEGNCVQHHQRKTVSLLYFSNGVASPARYTPSPCPLFYDREKITQRKNANSWYWISNVVLASSYDNIARNLPDRDWLSIKTIIPSIADYSSPRHSSVTLSIAVIINNTSDTCVYLSM